MYETEDGPMFYAISPEAVLDPDAHDQNGKLGSAMVTLRKLLIADDREAKRRRDATEARKHFYRTSARAFVTLVVYLAGGSAVMCTAEGWTINEAIYFCMVSM